MTCPGLSGVWRACPQVIGGLTPAERDAFLGLGGPLLILMALCAVGMVTIVAFGLTDGLAIGRSLRTRRWTHERVVGAARRHAERSRTTRLAARAEARSRGLRETRVAVAQRHPSALVGLQLLAAEAEPTLRRVARHAKALSDQAAPALEQAAGEARALADGARPALEQAVDQVRGLADQARPALEQARPVLQRALVALATAGVSLAAHGPRVAAPLAIALTSIPKDHAREDATPAADAAGAIPDAAAASFVLAAGAPRLSDRRHHAAARRDRRQPAAAVRQGVRRSGSSASAARRPDRPAGQRQPDRSASRKAG